MFGMLPRRIFVTRQRWYAHQTLRLASSAKEASSPAYSSISPTSWLAAAKAAGGRTSTSIEIASLFELLGDNSYLSVVRTDGVRGAEAPGSFSAGCASVVVTGGGVGGAASICSAGAAGDGGAVSICSAGAAGDAVAAAPAAASNAVAAPAAPGDAVAAPGVKASASRGAAATGGAAGATSEWTRGRGAAESSGSPRLWTFQPSLSRFLRAEKDLRNDCMLRRATDERASAPRGRDTHNTLEA
mmetsp:Transcript_20937/g.74431  ORF Transcript_20937/g.74431 Transcript_20937/m.74431 type:complete len:243 (-) Transcript_20937:12-740(-)